jgi:hypothetical protein
MANLTRIFVCSVVVMLAGLTARAADDPKSVKLFDGKTLNGWEGNEKSFRVEDGAIVGGSLKDKIPRNEFLATKKEYGDFELHVKFKLVGGPQANGGVQLRSQRIPNHHEMIGYQADMGDGWWGSLYDESRRNKVLVAAPKEVIEKSLKRSDCNEYRIRCQGKHIQLWINGEKTVDYTESDDKIPQRGKIALQIHAGPPSEAWYKEIVITEL